jgi:hypothetical protein
VCVCVFCFFVFFSVSALHIFVYAQGTKIWLQLIASESSEMGLETIGPDVGLSLSLSLNTGESRGYFISKVGVTLVSAVGWPNDLQSDAKSYS